MYRIIQKIIKEWKEEAGIKDPILFKMSKDKILYIYTTRPGYLIGRTGKLFYKYKELLMNEATPFWDINDIEMVEVNPVWA